jgi:ATP-dependent exoDNAse (exonuclease V) alpha subunit
MKSQGGNARVVILLTMPEHFRNSSSNSLYVGETRAREKLYHIGEIQTINESVGIKAEVSRQTNLCQFLTEGEF